MRRAGCGGQSGEQGRKGTEPAKRKGDRRSGSVRIDRRGRHVAHQHGVAVRRGTGHDLQRDVAGCPGTVYHHGRLAARLGQRGRLQRRDDIGASAWREGHDQTDRPLRPVSRRRLAGLGMDAGSRCVQQRAPRQRDDGDCGTAAAARGRPCAIPAQGGTIVSPRVQVATSALLRGRCRGNRATSLSAMRPGVNRACHANAPPTPPSLRHPTARADCTSELRKRTATRMIESRLTEDGQ